MTQQCLSLSLLKQEHARNSAVVGRAAKKVRILSNTIEQYREAKNTYLKLQAQAKKDLLTRFHQLEDELLQVQSELREDFGLRVAVRLKPKGGRV